MTLSDPYSRLVLALRKENVALIIGAGVSTAVAGLPSWRGAIKDAITHLNQAGLLSEQQAEHLIASIDGASSGSDLIDVATTVRMQMTSNGNGLGEFTYWLENTFHSDFSGRLDPTLLGLVRRLPHQVLMTTNYDSLLTDAIPGSRSISWRQPSRLAGALQGTNDVVHLHGVWDDPESIVLGRGDYESITSNSAYRSFLQAVWLSRTIIFIGCSFTGLEDPDFHRLLEWFAETYPNAAGNHFALMRAGSFDQEQARDYLTKWRIVLVPYGDSYLDLVPFLKSLIGPTKQVLPNPTRYFTGRSNLRSVIAAGVSKNQWQLVSGMGGIGKSELVLRVLADLRESRNDLNSIWIENVGDSPSSIAREIGRKLAIPYVETLDDGEILPVVKRALQSSEGPELVIIDCTVTAGTIQVLMNDVLDHNRAMLLLSRTKHLGFNQSHEVDGLDDEEATDLFLKLTSAELDRSTVQKITSLVEGHPLAIVLAAGRYIVDSLPLNRIVDRLTEPKQRLGTLRDADSENSARSSVDASLALSTDTLPEDLRSVLCFTASCHAKVSLEFVARCLHQPLETVEDFIGRLVRRSLLRRGSDGLIYVHSLVRDHVVSLYELPIQDTVRAWKTGMASMVVQSRNVRTNAGSIFLENIDHIIQFIDETTVDDEHDRSLVAVAIGLVLVEPTGYLYLFPSRHSEGSPLDRITSKIEMLSRQLTDPVLRLAAGIARVHYLDLASRYDEALRTIDELESHAQMSGIEQEWIAQLRVEKGNVYLGRHELPSAQQAFHEALSLLSSTEPTIGTASATGQLGRFFLNSRRLDDSEALYRRAMEIYQSFSHDVGMAACQANIAEIYWLRGNFDESWEWNTRSLESELRGGHYSGALGSLERLSSLAITSQRSDYIVGQVSVVFGVLPAVSRILLIGTQESISAMALFASGRVSEADQLLKESLQLRKDANDIRGQAVALGNLSNLAEASGHHRQASDRNAKSLRLYQLVGDLRGMKTCHLNGIGLALNMGRRDEAIVEACGAIQIAATLLNGPGVVGVFDILVQRVFPTLPPLQFNIDPRVLTYRDTLEAIEIAAKSFDVITVGNIILSMMNRFNPDGSLKSN